MGSESEDNGGGRGGGLEDVVPPEWKKMVQSVREVVGDKCTDAEVYAVLVQCEMDPNNTVQRLLSQDTFHEVKSKRDRRKEMKKTQELKHRNDTHGAETGNEYNVGYVTSHTSYNDLNKAAYERESLLVAPPTYGVKITNEEPSPHSDSLNAYTRGQITGAGDTSLTTKLFGLSKTSCIGGAPGLFSMADVVQMGKSQTKGSHPTLETSYTSQDGDPQQLLHCHPKSSNDSSPSIRDSWQELKSAHLYGAPKMVHGTIEGPAVNQDIASLLSTSIASKDDFDQFHMSAANTSLHQNCGVEEVQMSEGNVADKNLVSGRINPVNPSPRPEDANLGGDISHHGDGLLNDMTSYCSCWAMKENNKGRVDESISSAAVSLKQLHLGKGEPAPPQSGDNQSVVFPNYMQTLTADCSHLSFGTYKSGKQDSGTSVYLDDDLHDKQLGPFSNACQFSTVVQNIPVLSQPELNIPESATRHEYITQLSASHYSLNRFQGSSSPSLMTPPNAQNLSPLHRDMQASLMPMPVHLLTSTVKSLRVPENARTSFPGTQLFSRDSSGISSNATPALPMSDILYPGAFSLPKSSLDFPAAANLASSPVLPQHMLVQSNSMPAFSLEESANLTGYAVTSQKHALRQSDLQSGIFHDSVAGMKYSVPELGACRSSFPQTNRDNSGYVGFKDIMSGPRSIVIDSQYTRQNNYALRRQIDGSSAWDYAVPSFPEDIYYRLHQGQSQMIPGFEQSQQLFQNYSSPGHTNLYQSQTGIVPEQRQQSLGSTTFCTSHSTSKQLRHWQHRF